HFTQQSGTTSCGGPALNRHCNLQDGSANDGQPCTTATEATDCAGDNFFPGVCIGGPSPTAPFAGEVRDANNQQIDQLALNCLYLGGGAAVSTPPSKNPDGAELTFTTQCDGAGLIHLLSNPGDGAHPSFNCTQGPAASGKKCVDVTPSGGADCTSDNDCLELGNPVANACQPVARCFFGPPLPIPSGPTPTCAPT